MLVYEKLFLKKGFQRVLLKIYVINKPNPFGRPPDHLIAASS